MENETKLTKYIVCQMETKLAINYFIFYGKIALKWPISCVTKCLRQTCLWQNYLELCGGSLAIDRSYRGGWCINHAFFCFLFLFVVCLFFDALMSWDLADFGGTTPPKAPNS